jgi:TonB-linked SusC/RagA family outer membrane protein
LSNSFRRRRGRRTSPIRQSRVTPLAAALALAILPGALLVTRPLTLLAQPAAQQGTGRVTGTVVGEGNQPIANAQVLVVGTSLGVLTGADGRFSIGNVPAGAQAIRVQRIGYQPRVQPVTVTAGQVATVTVTVVAAPTTLTALVTVGYTNEQRRDVTGAVSSVRAEEIQDQKVATIEEALRGRVPGVQVSQGGEPGRPAQIVIRGQQTFGDPTPLYVVDGMYVGNVNPNLNPDDIETLEVLKDASAAAQYGAQASKGVIVIRTKRGRAGAPQISTNTFYGVQSVPTRIKMADAAEWQSTFQRIYAASGVAPANVPLGVREPTTVNTDWQEAVFQPGAIQNYNLQVGGGTEPGTNSATYQLSGSFTDQKGTLINTWFKRASVRANSEARFGRFTIGENLAVSQNNVRGLGAGGTSLFPLVDAIIFLPTIPVRDSTNAGGWGYGSAANPTFGVNPVGNLSINTNDYRANQVLGSVYGEVALVGGLRYRLNAGVDYNDGFNRYFRSISQLRFRTANAFAQLTQDRPQRTNTLVENLLNYDGSFFGDKHRLNAVGGLTTQRVNNQFLSVSRRGFTNENLQQIDAGEATGQTGAGSSFPSTLNSALVRATYAINDRYLVTASARRDCSSRFSPDNRCGVFGAGSIGWVMSEEGFFKSIPLLGRADLFKLRASTGVLGDQNIGEFAYQAPVATNVNYLFGGTPVTGTTQTRLVNSDLRWQSNRSTDVGFELSVLDNALTLTADYYRNQVSNLLVGIPIPLSLASDANPTVNAGAMVNAGFELGLNHRLQRGAWDFNTAFNLATNANRVTSLGNGGQPIFAGSFGQARTAVGDPIGSWFVRQTCGVFQSDAAAQAHTTTLENGTVRVVQPSARAGDLCYSDVNGDGQANDDDRVVAGNGTPRLTGGLFFNTKYRNVDVGLNLVGKYGYKIFSAIRFSTDRLDGPLGFRSGYQPWTPESPSQVNPIALINTNGPNADRVASNNYSLSERWLESGDFTRIQNLVVGYTLPQAALTRLRLANARQPRIYVNVQNLYTFTDYSGWDPDVYGIGRALARGEDDGMIYPTPRTVTFGLDLRF